MSVQFTDAMLTPPKIKWSDAKTHLRDFALITYAVSPETLASHLPDGVTPDVFTLDDGKQVAFVSAVPFRDHGFHFKYLPFVRVQMNQINYRAYVWYQGKRCVWFFGTTLTGPTVAVPRHLWKLPWHGASTTIEGVWEGERCLSYRMESKSPWGNASARLEAVGEGTQGVGIGRLDGFADEEETRVVLTHPLQGLFYRRDGKLGGYSVWHDKLELHHAEAKEARFEVFENLDLIDADSEPHSVLIQRETFFIIQLPPKRLFA